MHESEGGRQSGHACLQSDTETGNHASSLWRHFGRRPLFYVCYNFCASVKYMFDIVSYHFLKL